MRFDTKALLKLMKQSWRGGGVKIQRTEHRGLWDSFFITGAGWALLIPKENCPGEIAGQIVTWLADAQDRRIQVGGQGLRPAGHPRGRPHHRYQPLHHRQL